MSVLVQGAAPPQAPLDVSYSGITLRWRAFRSEAYARTAVVRVRDGELLYEGDAESMTLVMPEASDVQLYSEDAGGARSWVHPGARIEVPAYDYPAPVLRRQGGGTLRAECEAVPTATQYVFELSRAGSSDWQALTAASEAGIADVSLPDPDLAWRVRVVAEVPHDTITSGLGYSSPSRHALPPQPTAAL